LRLVATAVVKSGVAADTLVGLTTVLTPEVAAQGLQFLVARNNGSSSVQISNIALFLASLATRLEMPEESVTRLRRFAGKLKITQHGMTPRNREALRAFDDQTAVAALLDVPRRVLREVFKSGRRSYREAKLVQTALAVELLLNAPVRVQNLASIDLERHVVEVGTRGDRAVHLLFPAAEVKNANDLEFPLMPESVKLLDHYIFDWRPLLLGSPAHSCSPVSGPIGPRETAC